MKSFRTISILLIGCLIISCTNKTEKAPGNVSNPIQKANASSNKFSNQHLEMAVLWHQQAAEYKALCIQAYYLARLSLDQDLADKNVNLKRAVVLDIDETILDNSPYEASCVLDSMNYPDGWKVWCEMAKAEPIAGALNFLSYARANGVEIFYITNRNENIKAATLQNLKDKGFPQADEEHVLFKAQSNSKSDRRKLIAEKHHISLLIGDNLADFSEIFENKDNSIRKQLVDNYSEMFGRHFIILPNSIYGDWESALYQYNYSLSPIQKAEIRKKALKGFTTKPLISSR